MVITLHSHAFALRGLGLRGVVGGLSSLIAPAGVVGCLLSIECVLQLLLLLEFFLKKMCELV